MPVIGRLDNQVEAILINPLGRRQHEPGEQEEREQTPAPAEVSEKRDGADASTEKREADPALPVWLL